MPLRQGNATCADTVRDKTTGQLLCSLLAALVLIDIEGEIHGTLAFTELVELGVIQMRAERTGHVAKARLSQNGIVEQSFHENDLGRSPNLLPCIQAAFATGQK